MFIWRGFGVLVVVLTFVMLLLTEFSVERLFSDDSYYQQHGRPKRPAMGSDLELPVFSRSGTKAARCQSLKKLIIQDLTPVAARRTRHACTFAPAFGTALRRGKLLRRSRPCYVVSTTLPMF